MANVMLMFEVLGHAEIHGVDRPTNQDSLSPSRAERVPHTPVGLACGRCTMSNPAAAFGGRVRGGTETPEPPPLTLCQRGELSDAGWAQIWN